MNLPNRSAGGPLFDLGTASLQSRQPSDKIRTLGLCLGATSVSFALVERCRCLDHGNGLVHVVTHGSSRHEGDPKATLLRTLGQFDLNTIDRMAVTGRALRGLVNLSSISEPQAVELAYRYVKPVAVECPAVVSAGGETFMGYVLDRDGRVSNVLSGNKCASGTGEFFIQQLRRMNVGLTEAGRWAAVAKPYRVSGRCAVFCKSDCTHATNKGIPKAEVTAGLCRMMADKVLELLGKTDRRHVMLVGATARNQMMVAYLAEAIEGLIVPDEAPYFEALGTALWALDHPTRAFTGPDGLFLSRGDAFERLEPLAGFADAVTFETMPPGHVRAGDSCIVGLDVGSTTTKAVVLRCADNALLASVYLRTEADPVGASRKCYQALARRLAREVPLSQVAIKGLGVTGSGRQVAGLHALTDGVVNEIIAHAAAAAHFDERVDTIFEIGGQDAKYTYINNQVPVDYAMNEACSAGTGSFLEEAALETLGVPMDEIADIAIKAVSPPNFNDQCAAFIASDIKTALHEGISHADIVAGLVYSVCMNYIHRVMGNRPVGDRIFMQGGVCYNRAVPLAMAALVGKPIVVPPEPGLMGAFGVALVVKARLADGSMAPRVFDLTTLAGREVRQSGHFICKGGRDRCDRRCEIALIELEGSRYPFGGACNRYENIRRQVSNPSGGSDLVGARQKMVFDALAAPSAGLDRPPRRGTIGINRSFMTHGYLPLWATFFREIGFEVVLPENAPSDGVDQCGAAFCYPAQLSQGYFQRLLQSDPPPDFLFLPHVKALPSYRTGGNAQTCPIVQAEPFYLQAVCKTQLSDLRRRGVSILTPLLDLTLGTAAAGTALTATAGQMGVDPRSARAAFTIALQRQNAFQAGLKEMGQQALAHLARDPGQTAVVIFARPYNGFTEEAHMGIPRKLSTRGVMVLPMDVLPFDEEPVKRHMYWAMGQQILKAARFVKGHGQLFGLYITNFSCGPDSFLAGYFQELMGDKPSLTLELDSHTADAGLETRIEAFLDIVAAYRGGSKHNPIPERSSPETAFKAARVVMGADMQMVHCSSGSALNMQDPRVTLLFPSMGPLAAQAIRAVFRGAGFHARILPPADEAVLKLGRAHSTCKECLPLQLTLGGLLHYLRHHKCPEEVLVYFMPTGSGPCRFGQYAVFMEDMVARLQLPDVAIFSLSGENAYAGLGDGINRRGWWALVTAGIFEDMRAMLLANAGDQDGARDCFRRQWALVLKCLERGTFAQLLQQLGRSADRLGSIGLRVPAAEVPTVLLTGEIFVRHDPLSRQHLTRRLAKLGFATLCSPIAEWLHYSDFLVQQGLTEKKLTGLGHARMGMRRFFKTRDERRIITTCARSGLISGEITPIETIIAAASDHISVNLSGEAVLTVGAALTEVVSRVCGVIAIGPFGCMPNRISEAVLSQAMTRDNKLSLGHAHGALPSILNNMRDLPFLAIESDGYAFPQLINAKLEAFCLRARRLHAAMQQSRQGA